MPGPGRPDDVFDLFIARLPAEFGADLRGVGDQDGRVAGAPLGCNRWNRMTRYPACSLNDLFDRVTGAVTQVIRGTAAALQS